MSANTERIDRRLITLKTDAAKLPSWKIKTQKAGEKCCINMSKNVPYAVLPPQAEIGQTNISQLQMFDCLVRSILIFQQSTTSWYFVVYSLSNNNFCAIAVQRYYIFMSSSKFPHHISDLQAYLSCVEPYILQHADSIIAHNMLNATHLSHDRWMATNN